MRLSRRTILRGLGGTALALPALEAQGQTVSAPRRFVAVYLANGVFTPDWFPTQVLSETQFTPGPTQAPLLPWRDRVLWTGGIDLKVAVTGPGEQHQRGLGGLLTGTKLGTGAFVGNDGSRAGWAQGPSLDQALVPLLGPRTAVPSLQLGVHVLERDVSGVLSYAGADQPLLSQGDPRQVFRQLFGSASTNDAEQARARRRSVLDGVGAQLTALQPRVSAADRARLDEHLTLLRELEQRLTAPPDGTCPLPEEPRVPAPDSDLAWEEVAGLQGQLLALALRCDLTRVATLAFSDAKNHSAMPSLGITGDLHNLSHLADTDAARRGLGQRDVWVLGRVAALMQALAATPDVDGRSVLDNTLILVGSEVSRGNTHAHDNLPFLLAGGGAGFRMGRHVQWTAASHNDLLLAIYRALGGTAATFGDPAFCTLPLSNLT